MFIIILTYQKDLTVVEAHLAQHRAYLDVLLPLGDKNHESVG